MSTFGQRCLIAVGAAPDTGSFVIAPETESTQYRLPATSERRSAVRCRPVATVRAAAPPAGYITIEVRSAEGTNTSPTSSAVKPAAFGAIVVGAIIAIVSCYKGMTASGGAEGVGRSVNQGVVIAFLAIFAFNYVFTQTLLATHPEISIIK